MTTLRPSTTGAARRPTTTTHGGGRGPGTRHSSSGSASPGSAAPALPSSSATLRRSPTPVRSGTRSSMPSTSLRRSITSPRSRRPRRSTASSSWRSTGSRSLASWPTLTPLRSVPPSTSSSSVPGRSSTMDGRRPPITSPRASWTRRSCSREVGATTTTDGASTTSPPTSPRSMMWRQPTQRWSKSSSECGSPRRPTTMCCRSSTAWSRASPP